LPIYLFFFSSRRRHTRSKRDWSSDVCSSDLVVVGAVVGVPAGALGAPVAAYVFGGGLGVGTGGVVAILQAAGLEMFNATFAQSMLSDIVDKALIFTLAYVVVRSLPKRIIVRYPF